ncbi:MAG: cell division protein Fic [Melioribacteraceae bacterium]|nr:MAG: cell division protein Fic [Melioribacteraceae bacterium]
MGLDFTYIDGQTPIDEDEKEGLLIKTIETRSDLDEFEHHNIEKAIEWTLGKRWKADYILSETFILTLHTRMFGDVWAWAGQFRKTNKNLGVDKFEIGISLRNLIDDSIVWFEKEIYEPDEFAIRFGHRLVQIHCFPNGNGRHSRLVSDVISEKIFNRPVFTWGQGNLIQANQKRAEYIKAVKLADEGEFENLLKFARS